MMIRSYVRYVASPTKDSVRIMIFFTSSQTFSVRTFTQEILLSEKNPMKTLSLFSTVFLDKQTSKFDFMAASGAITMELKTR